MTFRYKAKLSLAFGERDIKAFLTSACAFKEKLQCKRRFSSAGLSLNQIQPFSVKAPTQDVVQPGNPSRKARFAAFGKILLVH